MERSATIRRFLLGSLAAAALLAAACFAWIWLAPCALGGCAPLEDLAAYQAEGSELLDIHDESYATLATVNRHIVSLDSLPPHLPEAFLAVEDQRFYDHGGIDFRRVAGAFLTNVRRGGVAEGGSTITQQLARNLFPEWLPYQERSLRRKIMEARVARQIERSFSKDKILELYLNHIYLGEGAYGVEAASQLYFAKPASQLTLEEAALLGGLPQAPSRINPIADRKAARERRDLVLAQMAEAGYISRAEARAAEEEPIRLAEGDRDQGAPHGSYFIEEVRREMEELVGDRFYTAGLRIHTTLDPRAQSAAERELARQLEAIEAGRFGAYRHPSYEKARGVAEETGRTPYLQGAVVLMDAATGEVLAMVGGRDFADSKFNRATQALRQPGSAFKPFVYAAALERYGSPAHVVEDAPIRMVLDDGQVWEPRNYTGGYDGLMTLRDALARSKNTVTVRVAQEVGMGSVVGIARELGITSDLATMPSAALGAVEVRPIELVRAYATLANGGVRVKPHLIRRVVDRHGRTVWEARPERDRTVDPALAFVLTSMLRDVVDRGTGSAARTGGYRGPAAGKTGTTNAATDVWFVGYTPELVAGVWMGLDEPSTIVRGASGGTLAAPVWGRIMAQVYEGREPPAAWPVPAGVSQAEVERSTGAVVGGECPITGPTYTEYFLYASPPRPVCRPVPSYAVVPPDTLWYDEEWGTYSDSIGASPGSPGIDWPELEELRRRLRTESEPLPPPYPGEPDRPGYDPYDPRSGPPGRQIPAPAPPDVSEPAAPPPPRLLGVPVEPRGTPPPAPADTTSSAGDAGNNHSAAVVLSVASSRAAAVSARIPTTTAHPLKG